MESLAGYWDDWKLLIMENWLDYGKLIYLVIIDLVTVLYTVSSCLVQYFLPVG